MYRPEFAVPKVELHNAGIAPNTNYGAIRIIHRGEYRSRTDDLLHAMQTL